MIFFLVFNACVFITGNDALHQLTKKNVSLYVSIADVHGSSYFKIYPYFSVESESSKYRLCIGGSPTGTLSKYWQNLTFAILIKLQRPQNRGEGARGEPPPTFLQS